MRHDHDWHRARMRAQSGNARTRAQSSNGGKAGGGIALMLLVGVFGGLVAERMIPRLPPGPASPPPLTAAPVSEVRFGLCHSGGGENCVVDGDTFWMSGAKIRVADIDTPETHPPRCAEEAELGDRATLRLQQLLNAGPVTLAGADRDEDRYGRKLRVVERDGRSLGEVLVTEGLARRWTGRRLPWCT